MLYFVAAFPLELKVNPLKVAVDTKLFRLKKVLAEDPTLEPWTSKVTLDIVTPADPESRSPSSSAFEM